VGEFGQAEEGATVHLVFVEEGAARPWLYCACEVAGAYEKLENCIEVRPSAPRVRS